MGVFKAHLEEARKQSIHDTYSAHHIAKVQKQFHELNKGDASKRAEHISQVAKQLKLPHAEVKQIIHDGEAHYE